MPDDHPTPFGKIEQIIREDFGPRADEARETFLAECDYVAERRWQERFAALQAGNPDVSIPAVHAE